MDDQKIIDLFWQRQTTAITETAHKYGSYCHHIAYNILANQQDAEECVNDTWLRLWNAIPPQRPAILRTFLGKITRNLSLNRLSVQQAHKRGSGEVPLVLHELEDCTGKWDDTAMEREEIVASINRFLYQSTDKERVLFIRRYWYLDPISHIAQHYQLTESNVSTILYRMRLRLRKQLMEEDLL